MKPLNIIVVILALVAIIIATMSFRDVENPKQATSRENNSDVLQAANQVVVALTAHDGQKLAALVHPEKGVRFSPSAFVDISSDLVFSRNQIINFWTDNKIYTWGFADGSGEPIKLTTSQYSLKYIMNRNFLSPSSINVNKDKATGNTHNNVTSAYPSGTSVEFYLEPSVREGNTELDWAALRLVFEKSGDHWFLIAVIHDEWST